MSGRKVNREFLHCLDVAVFIVLCFNWPSAGTVSVIDPLYDSSSSYWTKGYGQHEMQQTAMAETDFGGLVYSTDGIIETIAGHVLSSPAQLKASSKQRHHHRHRGQDVLITGGGASNRLERSSGSVVKRLNAKKTMAEISIPGMRAVFGGNTHVARRVIWIVILVTCFGIAVVQVHDRVMHFLSTPVTVNVRVSKNDTLRFPILSLCNKNLFNMTAIGILKKEKAALLARDSGDVIPQSQIDQWDIKDLVGVRSSYNITQLWNFISHSIDKMIVECFFGRNISCDSCGKWKRIYNYMGVCYSYELDNPFVETTGMFNNLYLKMKDTEPLAYKGDTSGWKILIHDRKDSPLIDLRTHGTTLYRGWAKDIRVYMRQFRTLNTKSRPCREDEDYSYSKCISRCFVDAVVNTNTRKLNSSLPICQLPFIPDDLLEPCSTPEEYQRAEAKMESLLFFGMWSTNDCTCPRQCNQDLYIPYTETTQMENVHANLGKLRVYYQDMTFDDIEEEIGYSAIPLLCDIGGSLGLLLGASVLTFFEIIEAVSAALLHLTHCCCRIVKLNERSPKITRC